MTKQSTCIPQDQCIGISGPNHTYPQNSNNNTSFGCVDHAVSNTKCPQTARDNTCRPFQLSKGGDSCFIDGVVSESLNIGGADINVYKLLGIHEQSKILDATGNGQAISGGYIAEFPATNAFDSYVSSWKSIQTGTGVLASSYIGYDFGEIKTSDGSRRRYGIDTSIRKHITALAIKQSAARENRVTRARVERSADGIKWFGVANVNLPDDDCLNVVLFNDSVLSRYWRLRPIEFNGSDGDYWSVQALQLFQDYVATATNNIQDKIFFENRDRDYSQEAIQLKGFYDLIDINTMLSKMGIELPSQTIYLTVNFSACVAQIGRPLIIGDIIELPSEAQFSAEMRRIKKWLEVTDVAWSTEGYTPGWQPTMLRIILQPAFASQETQDIFGDLSEDSVMDGLGLSINGDGHNPNFQDFSDISQEIQEQAKEMVPESGREMSSTIREWEQAELDEAASHGIDNLSKIGLHSTGLYVEDAMPANNAPFTEGEEFPQNPKHGDYHRMIYLGLSKDVPARLYRYSTQKNRWVFLEKDKRAEFDSDKPKLDEFLTSPHRRPHTDIVKKD